METVSKADNSKKAVKREIKEYLLKDNRVRQMVQSNSYGNLNY